MRRLARPAAAECFVQPPRRMRVVLPLAEPALSRRGFCRMAAAGCAALAIGGCVEDDGSVIDVGPLGADAGTRADGGLDSPDARPAGPACTGTPVDVGAPATFATGTATLVSASSLFIVRDAAGLYAVSSRCTHQNATNVVSSGRFRCPRHGALFTFDGDIISGPVHTGLAHFSICLLANGHVGVDRSTVVAKTVRLEA